MSEPVKVTAYLNHEGQAVSVAHWETTTPPMVGDLVPLPRTATYTADDSDVEFELPSLTGRVTERQWMFVMPGSVTWDQGGRAGLLDVLVEPDEGLFAFEDTAPEPRR